MVLKNLLSFTQIIAENYFRQIFTSNYVNVVKR